MRPVWLAVLAFLGVAEAQVGKPGDFQAALRGLNAKLLIQRTDAHTYDISESARIKHDPASKSIFVQPIGEKLGDQGILIAAQLLPNWCQTPLVRTSSVFIDALTRQTAQSLALLKKTGTVHATRSRLGQCEVTTVSNGWDSFIQLRFLGGKGVWPAQSLPPVEVKK